MADSTQPGEESNADAIRKAKKVAAGKLYYEKNKERIAAVGRQYREKNKERIAARNKLYYQKNKERIAARQKTPAARASQKRYAVKVNLDPEKRQRKKEMNRVWSKRYRERHPDRRRQIQKRYRENNPETVKESYAKCVAANLEKYRKASAEHARNSRKRFREKHGKSYNTVRSGVDAAFSLMTTMRNRVYMALKQANASKSRRTMELVGCSVSELYRHIESQFVEGMSWNNRGEWHIDHIVPLSKFDLADPEQQAIAFHYTNLQPLWAADNLRKSDKIIGQDFFGFAYDAKIASAASAKPKRRQKWRAIRQS